MLTRTTAILGKEAMDKLSRAHVVVAGCGGVGSYTVEALIRSGIGKITVIDSDCVDITNLNRQIIATRDTIGKLKVEVSKERAKSINPDIVFSAVPKRIEKDNVADIIPDDSTYIVDAIDYVPAKVGLAVFAKDKNIPIISCLGTGKRLDATKFEFCDIYDTQGCPLARKMRTELKKAGIDRLEVIFSKANVIETKGIGSVAFVPSVAGLLIAQKVICNITGEENK